MLTFKRAGVASASAVAGCTGPQSTLDPAGSAASEIADLFWVMTIGAVVIWSAVIALTVFAMYREHDPKDPKYGRRLIVGGGVIFPTVLLTGLLSHGLAMMPPMLATTPPPRAVQVSVTAEQFWWRVRYHRPGAGGVELANEIRMPVGERTYFELASPDVIHSFWIPALGGKMDMIPGRVTRLALHPERTGVFNGVCAEYCGASHALMAFRAVVLERDEFERWLAAQAQAARSPTGELAARGEQLFLENGCGACHTVRGTTARGVIGPDLTHVGGRLSLAAGTLQNDAARFARWLAHTDRIKPGVRMPHFGMLPAAQLEALAAYLEGLR